MDTKNNIDFIKEANKFHDFLEKRGKTSNIKSNIIDHHEIFCKSNGCSGYCTDCALIFATKYGLWTSKDSPDYFEYIDDDMDMRARHTKRSFENYKIKKYTPKNNTIFGKFLNLFK